jgi:hypothetical protein
MNLLSRAREVELLGEGAEYLQLADFHGGISDSDGLHRINLLDG